MTLATLQAVEAILPAASTINFRHLERQTMGDEELARELLVLYYDQAPGLLESIMHANDGRVLREAAHRLTGAASAVGANMVANAAGALETRLMQLDFKRGFPGEQDLISRVKLAVDAAQNELAAYLRVRA
jgi:HPt (histidine-containing phosphotransfer) domain-containing protein